MTVRVRFLWGIPVGPDWVARSRVLCSCLTARASHKSPISDHPTVSMPVVEPQNIVWFNVAMDEAGRMSSLQACCSVHQDSSQVIYRQWKGSQPPATQSRAAW